jgi:hypothetical protein
VFVITRTPPPLLPLLRVKRQQKQPISLLLSIYSYHPTAGIGEEKGWLTFLLCGKWVVEACFCRVDKSEASWESQDGGRRAHRHRRRRHHHHQQQLQIEKYRTRAHLRLTRRIIGMSRPRSNRAETNLQRLQKL